MFHFFDHAQALASLGMPPVGNMLGSKSAYAARHPNDNFGFNVRLVADGTIIWKGDLNVTEYKDVLDRVAEYFGKEIYVLSEHAAWDQQTIDYSRPLYIARMDRNPDTEPTL